MGTRSARRQWRAPLHGQAHHQQCTAPSPRRGQALGCAAGRGQGTHAVDSLRRLRCNSQAVELPSSAPAIRSSAGLPYRHRTASPSCVPPAPRGCPGPARTRPRPACSGVVKVEVGWWGERAGAVSVGATVRSALETGRLSTVPALVLSAAASTDSTTVPPADAAAHTAAARPHLTSSHTSPPNRWCTMQVPSPKWRRRGSSARIEAWLCAGCSARTSSSLQVGRRRAGESAGTE